MVEEEGVWRANEVNGGGVVRGTRVEGGWVGAECVKGH